MDDVLTLFHPLVGQWFDERLGTPTRIQSLAWKEIATGLHVLVTSPTGSGKTLAAFLWAINQLASGKWENGSMRVLYISPLKALNNDIRRNLMIPLQEIRAFFERSGELFPEIRVLTRSGDTPPNERRILYRHPPEILITTPESLNIMLTARGNSTLFSNVNTVILDEIHAVAGTKRGTHLITAVERVALAAGEFQRIALSATVRPMDIVADFIGGYELQERSNDARYTKRPVRIIKSDERKPYSITVEYPEREAGGRDDETRWQALSRELKGIILQNRSTLIFTKSRRVAERISRYLNEGEDEIIAYSHHGSIAREIRLEVEERMKKGELRAIVATSSLELGIDIGELDEVILVETPFSISSSSQRIGRAGHRVGETSMGRLYPIHGMDFLAAAVMAKKISEAEIEPLHIVDCPLDVLAQVIVSMTNAGEWNIDSLFAFIKRCYPYRNLSFVQYNLVLEMLAGRYSDSRLKELLPRISIDKIENTLTAKSGAAYLLYTSGGTIPDRGYYDMRVHGSRSKIGELDEEFVWERSVGDTFTLGTQIWRIQNITHNDVEVVPLSARTAMVPFWKAEEFDRDFYFSESILDFLKSADALLSDPEEFRRKLTGNYSMTPNAAFELADFLYWQRKAFKGKLPHRGRIVIEHYHDGSGCTDNRQIILHTFWGGRLNRPFSMALSAAWENKYDLLLETFVSDANILLILPQGQDVYEVMRMVTPENLEELLHKRLESSGYFGARFRENAGRALLLPASNFRKRYPLWLNRLRAKKLHETVMRYPDFPIVLETWRECLQDAFDINNLKIMLDELVSGQIELVEVESNAPSPFCEGLIWRQTNKYMYADDTLESRAQSGLSWEILDEILHSNSLRPRISKHLAEELEIRLQRLKPGYAPSSPADLLDWLKERLLIPREEWGKLLAACMRDCDDFPIEISENISNKIVFLTLNGSSVQHACALENAALVKTFFGISGLIGDSQDDLKGKATTYTGSMDKAAFLAQWLSYYGPMEISRIMENLGIKENELLFLLEELAENGLIIVDKILENSFADEVCVTDNLERLLRMSRYERRPSFNALPAEYIALFIATYQGLAKQGESIENLQSRLERLFGFPADAPLWEEEILPARMDNYRLSWLDGLLNSSALIWLGCGKKTVTFALEQEIDIVREPHIKDIEAAAALFPEPRGRYNLFDIVRHTSLSTEEAAKKLWDLAWKSAVINDSMETLRKGILNKFEAVRIDTPRHGELRITGRSGMTRWMSTRPLQGAWRILNSQSYEDDRLMKQEINKEKVRILLDRYGILFREILENEARHMRWKSIFPVLRLMELSGEIMSGYFFEGIPGVQFISYEAFRFLRESLDENTIYWMNAKDPASLCGIGLDAFKGKFPARLSSNHMVFQGKKLIIESLKKGRELRFYIPPDHSAIQEALGFFKTLLNRDFDPLKRIFVERINSVPARKSEYISPMREFGFVTSYNGLELRKRY